MEALGRILIADDENVFLDSTADLLREVGYHCDCVGDGPSAAEFLRRGEYDVLIADIKMPGNPNLELVQKVDELAEGLAVILVTGYPSMESAIKSVSLPVSAYLVKPVDFGELKSSVRTAVQRAKVYRAVRDTGDHLREWQDKISAMQALLRHEPGDTDPISVEAFVNVTLHNVVLSLAGLKNVTEAVARLTGEQNVCRLVDCPRLDTLIAALRDTIEVLERTKNAFKSKELGELRRRLETLVNNEESSPD
jgi:DNA-binding response OmpR family regulator